MGMCSLPMHTCTCVHVHTCTHTHTDAHTCGTHAHASIQCTKRKREITWWCLVLSMNALQRLSPSRRGECERGMCESTVSGAMEQGRESDSGCWGQAAPGSWYQEVKRLRDYVPDMKSINAIYTKPGKDSSPPQPCEGTTRRCHLWFAGYWVFWFRSFSLRIDRNKHLICKHLSPSNFWATRSTCVYICVCAWYVCSVVYQHA